MNIKAKTTTKVSKAPGIKDELSLSNQGIIFIKQSAMQEIYKKSGKLATSNEFQVHYWYLNLRFKAEDNSMLDIAIPTCYFNYKQEVSAGSIAFDLPDVIEVSNKVLPLHNMKVNQLKTSGVIAKIEEYFNCEFQLSSQAYGSIHRHPGSRNSQRFSSTDLCKTASEPGVVYPFHKANNTPNFAGIMTLDRGECNVARYEYRVASGELGKDLKYLQGGCTAIIVDDLEREDSVVERMLKMTSQQHYSLQSKTDAPIIDDLVELFKDIDFSPSTDAISDTHVVTGWEHTKSLFAPSNTNASISALIQTETESRAIIDACKNVVLHDEKTAKKFGEKKLADKIGELAAIYYADSNPKYNKEYTESLPDMTKDELVDEYMFMVDCVTEEYNQAIANVTIKPLDEELEQMKDELVNSGVAKSVIVTASKEIIRDWHAALELL